MSIECSNDAQRNRAFFVTGFHNIEGEKLDEVFRTELCYTDDVLVDKANFTQESFFHRDPVVYSICSFEVCPDTKSIHFHAGVYTSSLLSFAKARELWPKCNVQKLQGSWEQVEKYLTKLKSKGINTHLFGPFIQGTQPAQGKRTDLQGVKELLDGGATDLEVAQNYFGSFIRYNKGFQAYRRLLVPQQRTWKTEVFYFYGPPGTGKTREVYEREGYEKVYSKPKDTQNGGPWFDGYDQHEVILLDDFYGGLPWGFLLNLLDAYPLLANTKGGMVSIVPKRIYITSNVEVDELSYNKDLTPLKRRIENITKFTRFGDEFIKTVEKPDSLDQVAVNVNRELFPPLEADSDDDVEVIDTGRNDFHCTAFGLNGSGFSC